MTDLVRGADLLDRLLCLARRIGFGDGAPAELRMADLAEFAAVHHEVMELFTENARLEAITVERDRYRRMFQGEAARLSSALNEERQRRTERDEARAVARRLYRLGRQAPFPPDYDAYEWLHEED